MHFLLLFKFPFWLRQFLQLCCLIFKCLENFKTVFLLLIFILIPYGQRMNMHHKISTLLNLSPSLSSLLTQIIWMLVLSLMPHKSLRLYSFSFFSLFVSLIFTLGKFNWCVHRCSNSWILFFVTFVVLLSLASEFLIFHFLYLPAL